MSMILAFDVTKVIILKTRGQDRVMVQTTSPCPFVAASKITQKLCLDFAVSAGGGYEYVTEVLEVEPELIEVIDVCANSEPHCFSRRD